MHEQQRQINQQVDALASNIITLGGVPLSSPLEHINYGYIDHEEEGIFAVRAMLDHNLHHEKMLEKRLAINLETALALKATSTQYVVAEAQHSTIARQ